jgi:PKD repeat protein
LATFNYPSPGNYNVTLTVTNNCGSDVFNGTVNVSTVSLNEKVLSNINLFPNPAADWLNLSFALSRADGLMLNVYDAAGRLIQKEMHRFQPGNINHGVNILSLSPGIYMLELQSQDFRQTLRFVKQ